MRSRLIICRAPTSPCPAARELATAKRDVVSVESKTELEQGNVPDERSGTDLERDSENAAT